MEMGLPGVDRIVSFLVHHPQGHAGKAAVEDPQHMFGLQHFRPFGDAAHIECDIGERNGAVDIVRRVTWHEPADLFLGQRVFDRYAMP